MGALKRHYFGPSRSDFDWRAAKALKNFAGFIFVCDNSTIPDLDRWVFGLPVSFKECVRNIRRGMPLFLLNLSNRCLYGVFEAASDGGYNIDPYAWVNTEHSKPCKYANPVSKFPAQVRVSIRAEILCLDEECFRPILVYMDGPNFRPELTAAQVEQLLRLFDSAQAAERKIFAERMKAHRKASRNSESPRSTAKSDSDSDSDCSSRGLNSCEDEWADEAACENVRYWHRHEERAVSERLHRVALDECQRHTGVEGTAQEFGAANDVQAPNPVVSSLQMATVSAKALHSEILQFAKSTRPLPEVQLHVEGAIDCVREGVKRVWSEADVEVFGSFATGLCLQHSDVDLVVIDAPPITSSEGISIAQVSASLLRELATVLRKQKWCESLKLLDTASMPVLKCRCRPFGASACMSNRVSSVAVDITIGGMRNSRFSWSSAVQALDMADQILMPGKFSSRHTGGAAREYVLQKIEELPALAPLVLLLKAVLHHRNLSNVYSGGLGSFSLTLLVAFYLEHFETLRETRSSSDLSSDLPAPHVSSSVLCLPDLLDDSDASSSSCSDGALTVEGESAYSGDSLGKRSVGRAADAIERILSLWDPDGSPSLGHFLLGFLYTFGFLDLSCVKIVLKGIDGSSGGFWQRDDRHVALWIDDPLRPGVNIGAGSFGMVHVQTAFKEMFVTLAQCSMVIPPLQCEDKDCRDLEALNQLANIGRLAMPTNI